MSSTHLREHGQLFGKVDHARDGGGDDLGELAEGLQVHLVPIGGGRHRGLADLLRLETEEARPNEDINDGQRTKIQPARRRAEPSDLRCPS